MNHAQQNSAVLRASRIAKVKVYRYMGVFSTKPEWPVVIQTWFRGKRRDDVVVAWYPTREQARARAKKLRRAL